MNICFLCNNIIHPQIGGVERVTYVLTKEFQQKGVNILCVALKPNPKPKSFKIDEDIKQYILPNNAININEQNFKFLKELFLKNNVDIIVNQSTYNHIYELAVIVKKELTIKLISTLHTSPNYLFNDIKDSYLRNSSDKSQFHILFKKTFGFFKYPVSYFLRKKFLYQKYSKVYNQSDAVVLLSKQFKKKYIAIAKIENSNKLHAISNPSSFSESDNFVQKKNQVVFVGRMIFEQKRPDRLLKIWSKLHDKYPNWNLVMCGDGPDLNNLKKIALKLQLKNIEFTGNVNPKIYYEESKILCLTSSYEGFGMVLIEAMQYKCVPIAYDSYESLGDIIENNINGYKIPPFKSKKFIDKLELLMKNESLREKMSRNAMQSVRNFDAKVITQEWINLFKNVLIIENY